MMTAPLNQLLHEPPVYSVLTDGKGQITDDWSNWCTNIRQSVTQFAPITTLQNVTGTKHVSLSQATKMSTIDRDSLQNPDNGSFIYNTATDKFNFLEGGTWKEIP